jgi:hypothetical protein
MFGISSENQPRLAWNLHHRVRLVDGGNDSTANLILLHSNFSQAIARADQSH